MTNIYPYDYKISYNSICEVGGIGYFSCNIFNGLFSMDVDTGEIEFICKFEYDGSFKENLHRDIVFWKGKLIFIPFFSVYLSIYDIGTKQMSYIRLKDNNTAVFSGYYVEENMLCIFGGHRTDPYIFVDLNTLEISKTDSLESMIGESNLPNIVFYNECKVEANKVFGAIWNTNKVFVFDMVNRSYSVIEIKIDNIHLSSVLPLGNIIYCISQNDYNIYSYNLLNGVIETYRNTGIDKTDRHIVYCDMVNCSGTILVISESMNKLLYLDRNNLLVSIKCDLPSGCLDTASDVRVTWKKFLRGVICDDGIELFPYRTGTYVRYNHENNCCIGKIAYFDKNYINMIFREYYQQDYINRQNKYSIIRETRLYQVSDFIWELNKQ